MMTMKTQFKGVNEKIKKQDFTGALAEIEKSKDKYYEAKDRVMYYLDAGMLCHYAGQYEKSNEFLTNAEYAIEELYTASVSKAAASLLLNDNALDYAGEDYEDIYLNVFKALNYIYLSKWDDAIVEIKRINNKLSLLEDKYKKLANEYNKGKDATIKMRTGTNNFYNSALGRYISMLIYRAEGAWDSARIDRDKILEAFSGEANLYPFAPPNLDTALTGSGNVKVNFICFSGKSPDKVANTLRIRSQKNSLVIVPSEENKEFQDEMKDFAYIAWPGIEPDYYFKFQVPVMKNFGSNAAKIEIKLTSFVGVKATGAKLQSAGGMLESMERIAKFTFEVKKPITYLKTILRTVGKGLIAAEGKKAVRKNAKDDLLSDIFSIATDIVVDLSENADLRISHFFPAKASVAEMEIPAGTYQVVIDYYTKNGSLIFSDDKGKMEIKNSSLNLVESFCLE
jgi:hypothetical protein